MTQAAATETELSNLALIEIGEPPSIADMSEDTVAAIACRACFGTARDETLRMHHWNFATAWKTPAMIEGDSEGPLKKRYPLPEDCVKVRFVQDLDKDEWAVETSVITDGAGAEIETMLLVTNADAPLVCYTRRVMAVRLWDAQFKPAFAKVLGRYIAPHIAADTARASDLDGEVKEKVSNAAKTDARENAQSEVSRNTSWIAARGVGGYRG